MSAAQGSKGLGSYAVSEDEFNQMLAFTRTDTFAARRDRTSEFFRADKTGEVALKLLKHGGGITAGCTLGGVVIGGCVAGPKGMLIGGAAGLGVGLVATSIYGGVEIFKEYDDWKQSEEGKTVVENFIEFKDKLPAFKGLLCPINKDIIKDPVQIPCGHTFEKTMIEDWHDKTVNHKDGPTCPECRSVFTKTQLATDVTYVGKVKKACSDVLLHEANNPLFTPAIKKGFLSVQQGLDFQASEILKKVSTDLTLQLHNGDLTPQAFSRKMREVTEIFGEDELPKKKEPVIIRG